MTAPRSPIRRNKSTCATPTYTDARSNRASREGGCLNGGESL